MTETLYPIFYGTRLVPIEVIEATFRPHMHPESFRRGMNFLLQHGGLFGIGGGYRPPGTQPDKSGFAPEGKSFHQLQQFPSGLYYIAWDMVVVNPGGVHRAPHWNEVPQQGSPPATDFGWHMNVATEAWHAQPVEIDGWLTWTFHGRPDLMIDYPIIVSSPIPQPPQPPTPDPATQPVTDRIIVGFTSRNLVEGSVGNDVKFYQRQMNDIAGQGLTLDGHYGPKTTEAVKNWQRFFQLTVDGQMGEKTQRSIIEVSLQV